MTSGSVSKRRRQLVALIPVDKKKEMKETIRVEARKRTEIIHKLSVDESQEINDIKNKYRERRLVAKRDFERTRTNIIEKYEKEFGVDVVQYALEGLGV